MPMQKISYRSLFLSALCTVIIAIGNATFVAADTRYRSINVISTVTAEDISALVEQLHPKAIRYSLTFGDFADTATKDEYFAAMLTVLDNFDATILPVLQANNVKVILSLANPPGGFFTRSGALPKMRIFQESWAQEAMKELWVLLAQRYASNTSIVTYHLQNEPAIGTGPAAGLKNWYDLQSELITLIRQHDTTHSISTAADYSNPAKLAKIKIPNGETNVWYSFNMYYPTKFLRQGVELPSYKTSFPSKNMNKAQIIKYLKKTIAFGKKKGRKLFVTEFTTTRFAPAGSGPRYLKQVLSLFESKKWFWAYHAWREADPWSTELPALEDNGNGLTERAKILKGYFAK